uniref:Serpin domain-containing protein n=1 Tax=Ditylenchus dipsaci TaxID=166011 RepID=A0A915CV36_9BILA
MFDVNQVQLEFAFDLLRQTTVNSPTKSVVICPVAVANSLAMLSCGCRGKTKNELQNALGYCQDDFNFHFYFHQNAQALREESVESMLKIANRLYVPKEFDIMHSFQNFAIEKYLDQAHSIDLDSVEEGDTVYQPIC